MIEIRKGFQELMLKQEISKEEIGRNLSNKVHKYDRQRMRSLLNETLNKEIENEEKEKGYYFRDNKIIKIE